MSPRTRFTQTFLLDTLSLGSLLSDSLLLGILAARAPTQQTIERAKTNQIPEFCYSYMIRPDCQTALRQEKKNKHYVLTESS